MKLLILQHLLTFGMKLNYTNLTLFITAAILPTGIPSGLVGDTVGATQNLIVSSSLLTPEGVLIEAKKGAGFVLKDGFAFANLAPNAQEGIPALAISSDAGNWSFLFFVCFQQGAHAGLQLSAGEGSLILASDGLSVSVEALVDEQKEYLGQLNLKEFSSDGWMAISVNESAEGLVLLLPDGSGLQLPVESTESIMVQSSEGALISFVSSSSPSGSEIAASQQPYQLPRHLLEHQGRQGEFLNRAALGKKGEPLLWRPLNAPELSFPFDDQVRRKLKRSDEGGMGITVITSPHSRD